MNSKIHIIVAESSPVISAGLSFCLSRLPGIQAQTVEVNDPADLLDSVKNLNPDLLVVNPTFGGSFSPTAIRELAPQIKIAAIEISPLDRHARLLYDDALSVVEDLRSIASKVKALTIQQSAEGEDDSREPLSLREKEIITLVVKGLTNKEIADKLFLSVYTVMTHRRNIARKLEIHSATGLTIYAIVNRLVDISEIKI